MTDRIAAGLRRLFEDHRIVFWYDAAREMRDAFEAVVLEGVEKVEIQNNEFGLKYRILRQEPQTKFLIYNHGPRPNDRNNWLLDMVLASGEMRADQTAMLLAELGLDLKFDAVIRDHAEFFRSTQRRDELKKRLKAEDGATQLRRRMLGVCTGATGAFDTVIEALLAELATGRDEGLKLIERAGLTGFLWEQIGNDYGYRSETPGLEDFALTLFKSCYAMSMGEPSALNQEAPVLLGRWKNDRIGRAHFATLSRRFQAALAIAEDAKKRELPQLQQADLVEELEREIIRRLVQGLASQTLSPTEALRVISTRTQSSWYDEFAEIYQTLRYGAEFQQTLTLSNIGMTTAQEGIKRYTTTWFKLDQFYRKFIYHSQKSSQPSLLGALGSLIENLYVNNYLTPLNNAWQNQLDQMSTWDVAGVRSQKSFYEGHVKATRGKVFVIISDALRYEIAEECLSRIRALDRFDAGLDVMLASLPSYTQLGMASLLPHAALAISETDPKLVTDAGRPTGSQYREKMLAAGRASDRVATLRADELKEMRGDDAKAFVRDHDVVYIYHNQIDAIGDKVPTEDRVFEAAESTLEELVTLVKKLTSANASTILITADHGFIYQHRTLGSGPIDYPLAA
ncbi:BREX-1 system phosphatase PglZ type A [Xinfangfangia sp. CPCC 101601]|uniref:BREX-1 system phosphatase PglZ type A n=1 Tax=Pseudogemmobacter lacusdianii TaxID=3069608 RepID=A0ABU0W2H1_9RHOB|nr:BREX-1 system phosphatase PglZ type A [Xinfangfangia sp. CPCC 101601]MDQ2068212.1 BREX-1 system phosphatase PglZ type A [Xinfangfangia sp. CPCC 101601]